MYKRRKIKAEIKAEIKNEEHDEEVIVVNPPNSLGVRQVLAIDPGTTSIGVCLIEPFSQPQVRLLREFNLSHYAPQECGSSCYSKGSVTTSSIGACISRMVLEEPEVFGHVQQLEDGSYDDSSMTVVIEKQMNVSPENCCVASTLQLHYTMQGVECCILNPTNLTKFFPRIFAGTKGNRSKRKTAINKYGKRLLTMEENSQAPVGVSREDSKKKKRKPSQTSYSIHALDAMFYGMVYCALAPDIQMNIIAERIHSNSQLKQELNQRLLSASSSSDPQSVVKKEKGEKKKRSYFGGGVARGGKRKHT